MTDNSAHSLPAFSAGGHCEQFWHGKGCPLFDAVHPPFPLLTTALPFLPGALKYCFGEAFVACSIPVPCEFLSFDSYRKRFLRTDEEVDLAPRPFVGLVLQAGDAEKFPHAAGFESLDPFFRVSKQGPCFTAIEEDRGDKRHTA